MRVDSPPDNSHFCALAHAGAQSANESQSARLAAKGALPIIRSGMDK